MGSPKTWLFDLDNTLHDASPHIFPHINRSMTAYLVRHLQVDEATANTLRIQYWHRYGATLLGLMRHHGTDPHHFLAETHRFPDIGNLMVFDRGLKAMLRKLPGAKFVFSNGPRSYAESIVRVMGLGAMFEDIFGIEDMGFHPKPSIRAYHHLVRAHRLNPRQCILVEDSAENLRTAKRLGMQTVWVDRGHKNPAYVDYKIPRILNLCRLGLHRR